MPVDHAPASWAQAVGESLRSRARRWCSPRWSATVGCR